MNRLEGESRYLPNLHFDLSKAQLHEVAVMLEKLEGAHRTRVNWMGPYSLEGNRLSIHALARTKWKSSACVDQRLIR